MNKKLITMLCAFSLTVSVTGCTTKNNDTTSTKTNTTTTTTQVIDTTKSEEIKEVDTYIELGDSIDIKGNGASVENNVVTITSAGTYSVSGQLKDGQIIVSAGEEDKVQIQLNNANLTCSNSAPVYVKSAKRVVLALNEGTENTVTDGKDYVFEDESTDEPNAAIYSKDDLTIIGNGSLIVNANYNNGITSKDDLKIEGGQITVNAVSDGLRGKDSVTILDGQITIDAKEDGIKSSNDEDEEKGYIHIAGGEINIASGDDGIHAESTIEIEGGDINITKSYEGIESQSITINDGNIHIVASDDGINAGGGNDGSANNGRPGENNFNSSSTCEIVINGGYTVVDASGDGIDANGSITITGGTTIVNGPENGGNGALDYDTNCDISGGTLIAAGSVGMAQSPSSTSSQNAVNVALSSQSANTIIHIEDESGNEIITFAPSKQYQSVVVSSPKLKTGTTYTVSYGGTSTGEVKDGLYSEGKYSGGTESESFTVSDTITNLGTATSGNMGGPGAGQMGGGKGNGGPRPDRNGNMQPPTTQNSQTDNIQEQ